MIQLRSRLYQKPGPQSDIRETSCSPDQVFLLTRESEKSEVEVMFVLGRRSGLGVVVVWDWDSLREETSRIRGAGKGIAS